MVKLTSECMYVMQCNAMQCMHVCIYIYMYIVIPELIIIFPESQETRHFL